MRELESLVGYFDPPYNGGRFGPASPAPLLIGLDCSMVKGNVLERGAPCLAASVRS
jgi:hypothetical protein